MSPRPCRELAEAQLAAYNAADLDAFCACYHPDVKVLDAEGAVKVRGLQALRASYAPLFADYAVGARVDDRIVAEPHAVDDERWWRTRRSDGKREEGRVLVRYTAKDGLIAVVEFLREGGSA